MPVKEHLLKTLADQNRFILLVQGPDDGLIVDGIEASILTVKVDLAGNEVATCAVGDVIEIASRRLRWAHRLLGVKETETYFSRFGVAVDLRPQKYKITHIIDSVYVARHVNVSNGHL